MSKYTYFVMQGLIKNSGYGNYWEEGRFTTLKDAKKCFNEVKRNVRDVNIHRGFEYLNTLIEKCTFNENNQTWECIDFKESFEYRG